MPVIPAAEVAAQPVVDDRAQLLHSVKHLPGRVAQEAGVVRGLIHHYFGTRRDLYLEVVRTMMMVPPLEEVQLPTGTPRERNAM